MNPPESLLQAAHRDADPTAALACADWYDEHDQPEQARLMRLSVRLEQLGPGHPDALAIELEAEKLGLWLDWHREVRGDKHVGVSDRLSPEMARGMPKWFWERDDASSIEHAIAWFDRTPVRGVSGIDPDMHSSGAFWNSSIGQRLVRLNCSPSLGETDAYFREFSKVGDGKGLIELQICLHQDRDGFTNQTPLDGMKNIRRLKIVGGHAFPMVIVQLGKSIHARQLQHVELCAYTRPESSFTAKQIRMLGDPETSPRLRSWTTLGIRYTPGALAAFAHPDLWPDLESLSIDWHELDRAAIGRLGPILRRGTLRSLRLYTIHGGRSGSLDFFRAAGETPGLRRLEWATESMHETDCESIAAWPGLVTVTHFTLGMRALRVDQLRLILQSPNLRAIQQLTISSTLNVDHLNMLSEWMVVDTLCSLDISLNSFQVSVMEALIRMLHSKGFTRLRSLVLSTGMSESGFECLARQLEMSNLERLQMGMSYLGLVDLCDLLESPRLPKLAWVELEDINQMVNMHEFQLPDGWWMIRYGTFIHPERLR